MKNLKPMIISGFILDGVRGYVHPDKCVSWAGIHCHLDSLADSELKTKAVEALQTMVDHNKNVI